MTPNTKLALRVSVIFIILVFVLSGGKLDSIISSILKLLPIALITLIPVLIARKYFFSKDENEKNDDYNMKL